MFTAELDPDALLKAIWCVSKIRPDVKMCFFGVKKYKQLFEKMAEVGEKQLKILGGPKHQELLEALAPLTSEVIDAVAQELGFDDEWLQPCGMRLARRSAQMRSEGWSRKSRGARIGPQGGEEEAELMSLVAATESDAAALR